MDRAYDSAEGIESEYLKDLEGLNRLITDRMRAGYDRRERLRQFVVLGHWMTDSCGNFGKCTFQIDYRPVDVPKGLARVVDTEDLFRTFKGLSISTGSRSDVPEPCVRCPECGKGWTIEDAHDARARTEDRVVALTPGKSVAERERDWDGSTEGVFRFGPEPSVRNPKFVDLSPHPEYKGRTVNEKGWRHHHPPLDHERLTRKYVAEEGDEASVTVFIYEHIRCMELRKARWAREFFEKVLDEAGVARSELVEIPNEYCQCEVCGPWFVAKTPAGDVKVGWRKRVINIDWSATGRGLPAELTGEDVTKGAGFIHAWGRDNAVRYLKAVMA